MERAEWSTAGGEGLGFMYPEFGMERASSIRATMSRIDGAWVKVGSLVRSSSVAGGVIAQAGPGREGMRRSYLMA